MGRWCLPVQTNGFFFLKQRQRSLSDKYSEARHFPLKDILMLLYSRTNCAHGVLSKVHWPKIKHDDHCQRDWLKLVERHQKISAIKSQIFDQAVVRSAERLHCSVPCGVLISFSTTGDTHWFFFYCLCVSHRHLHNLQLPINQIISSTLQDIYGALLKKKNCCNFKL